MEKLTTKKSRHLHLGKIGELLAKAKFIEYGFDVFATEVDNKGVDFIIRNEKGRYFEIQVKATNQNYVFIQKEVFTPKDNLLVALLIFNNSENPFFILIPSLEWRRKRFNFLVDRNFEGKKSKPEYGININKKSTETFKNDFPFSKIINELKT